MTKTACSRTALLTLVIALIGPMRALATVVEAGLGTDLYRENPDRARNIGWFEVQHSAWDVNWTGRVDQQWRYGESDQLLSLSGGRSLSPHWTLAARIAASSAGADLFPRQVAEVTPYYLVTDNWLASMTVRHSGYPQDRALTAVPGIEAYMGAYRFAYSVFLTRVVRNAGTANAVADRWALASSLAIDHYYRYRSHIGTRLSVSTEQVTLGVVGLHGWSPEWATRWRVQASEHSRFGLQAETQIGVQYRF